MTLTFLGGLIAGHSFRHSFLDTQFYSKYNAPYLSWAKKEIR